MGSTDKTTVNTDQIAAEAWDKAIALYTESGNRQEAINEVLSAIEKARGIKTTEYAKGWDDHVAAVRAAHASEPTPEQKQREYDEFARKQQTPAHASEECVICGGTRIKGHKQDCPNYEPAHASETCDTCGRPSIENGVVTHLSGHSFKQPAHASELSHDEIWDKLHGVKPAHASEFSTAARTDFRDIAPQQSADTKRLLSAARNTLERVGRIAHEGKIEAGTLIKIRAFALSMVEAIDAAMQKEKE